MFFSIFHLSGPGAFHVSVRREIFVRPGCALHMGVRQEKSNDLVVRPGYAPHAGVRQELS